MLVLLGIKEYKNENITPDSGTIFNNKHYEYARNIDDCEKVREEPA